MHLVNVIGPPAAGKMTVGRELCELTGFRLFHNHMSIEPLLGVFDFGTPSFSRLNSMIRREVIAEAVAADLPGLVFTYAWDFDDPRELQRVEHLIEPVVRAGCPVDFVELYAAQPIRLAREGGADRMDHKRSKRDVEWARAHVVELDQRARFNTDPTAEPADWPLPQHRLVRLDNSHASPRVTAERIIDELGLPGC
ncbi:AAA family ATPase [Monashia sp. NPDC004114]